MFTVEQINAIHSKVKTGADFPQYVQDLKALGMEYYDNYVAMDTPNIMAKTATMSPGLENMQHKPLRMKATSTSLQKKSKFTKMAAATTLQSAGRPQKQVLKSGVLTSTR